MSIKGLKKDEYDVIIIGAGVGGLVCGCYLAKAGMKVLIVEKNSKVGGYCQSFTRNGFTFDACVHSLGSMGENCELRKIFNDLELDKRVKIIRSNPSDILITPKHIIKIMNSIEDTINEFQRSFPKESINIKNFFYFITKTNFLTLYVKLKNKTFNNLLDEYITDKKLKAILTIPLGNIGLPSRMASALVSVILYREFIFNGGYYPLGGMQAFSNSLADNFQKYGGELFLSTKAKKILLKNKKAIGIIINNNELIKSRYIVSNCDAKQTFLELIGKENISESFINLLNKMIPSVSAFVVYLGINKDLTNEFEGKGNIWYASSYDIENIYSEIVKGEVDSHANCILIASPSFHDASLAPTGKQSLMLVFNSPFKTEQYWENEKIRLGDRLLKKAEDIVGKLSDYLQLKDIATPLTLFRYTLNYQGAAYGWAAISSQISRSLISHESEIEGLFLSGHWCMRGAGQGGISTVACIGRDTAKLILNQEKL